MRKFVVALILVAASLVMACAAQSETITLRFTVPSLGQADSTSCTNSTVATTTRAVSLWLLVGPTPTTGDPLVVRKLGTFSPGSLDSVQVSYTTSGTRRFYIRSENTAGRSCPSNVVTVDFDGVPPAKIVDLGR